MKNLLQLLLLLVLPCSIQAQSQGTVPDLEKIRKEAGKKESPLYFPELMRRFRMADTSLSLEQKRALYYGAAYQEETVSSIVNPAEDSIRKILNYDELLPGDYQRILAYSDTSLKSDQLSLRMLQYRMFAAKRLKNEPVYFAARRQWTALLEALFSTGDGKTLQTAIWVTNVPDEYEILKVLGLQFGGEQKLFDSGPCDYLTLADNKAELKGMYFNVSISFEKMAAMFSDDSGKKKKSRR